MAILRTKIPDMFLSLLANLQEVIYQTWNLWPSQIQMIFNMPPVPNKPFVNDTAVSDLTQFVQTGENVSVTYVEPVQLFDKKYTFLKWALGLKFSEEAVDDQKWNLVAEMGRALARSGSITREVSHANILNRAFNALFVGPDGVSLCNVAHPLGRGGLGINRMAAAALGATSLELALNVFDSQVTDSGNTIHIPYKNLVLPPELQWQGAQLLNSTLLPGVANNDINPLKGILDLVKWSELTDAAAWFVMSDKSQHKIKSHYRKPFGVFHGPDFDTGGTKTRARYREDKGWSDWRGIVGVPSS